MIYYFAIYDILLFYLIGMETSGGGFGGIVRQLYRFYPLDVGTRHIFVTLTFVELLAQRKRKQVSSPFVLSPLRSESVSFVAERGNESKKLWLLLCISLSYS